MIENLTEERSRIMRAVKSKNTGPEMIVRRLVHSMGYRYRLHRKDLPGKPDIVFVGKRLVIFVDGCFWHGCPVHGTSPKTNAVFWETKIKSNIERDKKVTTQLTKEGWNVMRFWEHEIKSSLNTIVDDIIVRLSSYPSNDG